jgi:type II secretory pathway predicted ATPase ExeA
MELPSQKLITFILFGLKELDENIHLDEPLAQRVALNYKLSALSLIATENYIKHRLKLSGAKRMYFSKEAVEKIYYYSRGIPRLINTICDNAMFETFIQKKPAIDATIITDVSLSLGLNYYLTKNTKVIDNPINKNKNILSYKAIDDILNDFNKK